MNAVHGVMMIIDSILDTLASDTGVGVDLIIGQYRRHPERALREQLERYGKPTEPARRPQVPLLRPNHARSGSDGQARP
jgi:hypothetical protein